jgi:hypothetical protein
MQRVVRQWRAGHVVTLQGKVFAPTKSTLRIYEGPRLTSSQTALGQGWLDATKFGENVTDELLHGDPSAAVAGKRQAGNRDDRWSQSLCCPRSRHSPPR